jgi:hypothetical protein
MTLPAPEKNCVNAAMLAPEWRPEDMSGPEDWPASKKIGSFRTSP